MQVSKGVLALVGLFVVLVVTVAYLLGSRAGDPATAATPEPVQAEATASRAKNKVEAKVVPAATPVPEKVSPLISSCYHLDSCGYWRIVGTPTSKRLNAGRLVKATLQYGEYKGSTDEGLDPKKIAWDSERNTTYAFCSPYAPRIAWKDGGKYTAEEFDFAGNGIPGVQQNNARIYEALCHGFYNGELEERAARLGYEPLPDGGRGQFEITSPELLAGYGD